MSGRSKKNSSEKSSSASTKLVPILPRPTSVSSAQHSLHPNPITVSSIILQQRQRNLQRQSRLCEKERHLRHLRKDRWKRSRKLQDSQYTRTANCCELFFSGRTDRKSATNTYKFIVQNGGRVFLLGCGSRLPDDRLPEILLPYQVRFDIPLDQKIMFFFAFSFALLSCGRQYEGTTLASYASAITSMNVPAKSLETFFKRDRQTDIQTDRDIYDCTMRWKYILLYRALKPEISRYMRHTQKKKK